MTGCHFSLTVDAVQTVAAPKRARTRDALLAALQELLLDPRMPPVSVPQVVGRCGVSQGTFYNYFDSLPDAIDAVGALILAEHARVLALAAAGAADEAEIVARSARQTLMLLARRPDVGRLMFDSGLPADRFGAGMRAHLRADVQRGVDSGVFTADDVDVVCSICAGVILGTSLDIYRGRLRIDSIPAVVTQLLGVLGVGARRAQSLVAVPQEFIEWAPLPLSAIEEM